MHIGTVITRAFRAVFVDANSVPGDSPRVTTEAPAARTLAIGLLKEDIAAYKVDLAGRGMSRVTSRARHNTALALAESLGVASCDLITPAGVMDWISTRSATLEWSAKTHDNAVDSLRDFGRFLERRYGERLGHPFIRLPKARRVKTIYGTVRTGVRAFTPEESDAVIDAARRICQQQRQRGGCSNANANRDWCYEFFRECGLRHNEMKLVRRLDIHVDKAPHHIMCDPSWCKNRKFDHLPLSDRAVEIVRAQLAHPGTRNRAGEELLWRTVPSLNCLNADMERAGVPKIDHRGRNAGFHSFRKELDTETGKTGMPLDVRMQLMRHSDPRLTLGAYSDLRANDLAKALREFMPVRGGGRADLSTTGPQPPPKSRKNLTAAGRDGDTHPTGTASHTLAHKKRFSEPSRVRGPNPARDGEEVGCRPTGAGSDGRPKYRRLPRDGIEGSNPSLSASTFDTEKATAAAGPQGPEAVVDALIALLVALRACSSA